ncbi:hypothetical protein GSI_00055 [Ganoderma sinense ZZ0214-1]|uniref:Uncharacterized protein n=1 Tax=Ganoderma sinense ZZ0214-1 TaxID=1077348 RepID=A0A2G8SRH4_9APHY|nr:hypothetical protein GSI_00055 [Ganoderma sinense ZZ0214-1]
MGMGMGLAASRVTADFLSITGSSRSPTSAADLRAAYTSPYSPTTSTPVRDAMRRALAVMIMHRGNSPQPRRGRRGTRSTSPLSRAELVGLPAGEAAARIVAAVKAREQDRTRAWAAAQASAGAGAPVRYGDVSGETGAEGSGDEDKARL